MESDSCLIPARFSRDGHYHGIQAPEQLETSTGSQRPMQKMLPLTPDVPSPSGAVKVLGGMQRLLPPIEGEDFPTFHQLA